MKDLIVSDFSSLLERLSEKYSEFTTEDFIDVIEFSIYALKRLRNDPKVNVKCDESWIKKCCYEQLDKMQMGLFAGVKAYSENGFSFTLDSGDISLALQSLIVPKAKCFDSE